MFRIPDVSGELVDAPDVVENESAGVGCRSNVGSKGQLVTGLTAVHPALVLDLFTTTPMCS